MGRELVLSPHGTSSNRAAYYEMAATLEDLNAVYWLLSEDFDRLSLMSRMERATESRRFARMYRRWSADYRQKGSG